MTSLRTLVLLFLWAAGAGLLTPDNAAAQPAAAAPAPLKWTITPYVAGAMHSAAGKFFGITPDRDHLFIGVHGTAIIEQHGRFTFGYAPELVPVLMVTNNPKYRTIRGSTGHVDIDTGKTGPVFGMAIAPIGFEIRADVTSRWRLYSAGAAGGVWFTRHVPILEARSFNFILEFGGGLDVYLSGARWLRLGYKFHHISNWETALANPGIDAHVLLVGLQYAVGKR